MDNTRFKQWIQERATALLPVGVIVLTAAVAIGIYSSVSEPGNASASDLTNTEAAIYLPPEDTATGNENTEADLADADATETEDALENDGVDSTGQTAGTGADTQATTQTTSQTDSAADSPPQTETSGGDTTADSPKSTPTPIETERPTSTTEVKNSNDTSTERVTQPLAKYTATLSISGIAQSGNYTIKVPAGATVQDVMNVARGQGLNYTTKQYSGLGSYVSSINGVTEDQQAGMYWVYRVNGVRSSSGISIRKIENGDHVEWRYEKGF